MRHRHLEVDPATPVAEVGSAVLDDLLERGDLDEWTPILRAIRRDPHGEVAARVRQIVDSHPMYGVSALWRDWIAEQQAGTPAPFDAGSALRLLRLRRGLTQQQLAERLGTTQPEVSKLERRRDVRLSTLRAYVGALGGTLALVARFGDDRLELE